MVKDRMTAVFSPYVRTMLVVETNQMKTTLSVYINQPDLKTNVHLSSDSAFSSRITLTGL